MDVAEHREALIPFQCLPSILSVSLMSPVRSSPDNTTNGGWSIAPVMPPSNWMAVFPPSCISTRHPKSRSIAPAPVEYRVDTQVRVGTKRIDLLVEGADDRRLAIKCDGDAYHGPDAGLTTWRDSGCWNEPVGRFEAASRPTSSAIRTRSWLS